VKDAFHNFVIRGEPGAVNAERFGTKAASIHRLTVPAGSQTVVRLRLTAVDEPTSEPFEDFDEVFATRIAEADYFYAERIPAAGGEAASIVSRQAYAGLLWSKQFYHYVVKDWLAGAADQPPPPASRRVGRNHDWPHLFNRDVISMPDKWEYPWYAAWDLSSCPGRAADFVEEAKNARTMGMLLCLDRKQRLTLTPGETQRARSSPCNEGVSSCYASIELLVSGSNFEHVANAQSRMF
jgi:hypothetical protein